MLCHESGHEFLSSLTAFTNLILAGGCPADISPIFFGGRLLALSKKSGGVRPIAIGFTLRRLASKCANSVGSVQLRGYFCPRQQGVGIPGGCEAAVYSARRFLEALPADNVVVKMDFSNTFNSLHRVDMLQAVADRLPALYAFCFFSAYSHPSTLFFGQYRVSSQVGPQQGDPIGPLLFCNTVHPMLLDLESQLNLGYLDDLTLGGSVASVARDVAKSVNVGNEMGLSLNVLKCELIAHNGLTVSDSFLQTFPRLPIADAALLRAPLFPGSALDKAWSDRCAELTRAVDRLQVIGLQEAFILLRASFSAPKVLHLLRCSPLASHSALLESDRLLRTAIERITNSSLTDSQWLQASLPSRDGGRGVRRVSSLAISAFLASAASTVSPQDEILANCQLPKCHY